MLHPAPSLARLGTEPAFTVLARALAVDGRDIINLGIGQPDFRTPEHIVEAGIKALRDGEHGYTPAIGPVTYTGVSLASSPASIVSGRSRAEAAS